MCTNIFCSHSVFFMAVWWSCILMSMNFLWISLLYTCTLIQKCFFPDSLRAEFPAKVNRQIPSPGWMKFPCHVVFSISRPTIPLLLFQTPSLPPSLSLSLSQSRRPLSFPFSHTHCSPEFHSDSSVSVNAVNISASCLLRVTFQLPGHSVLLTWVIKRSTAPVCIRTRH